MPLFTISGYFGCNHCASYVFFPRPHELAGHPNESAGQAVENPDTMKDRNFH